MFGVRKPGKKSYGSQSPWSAKAGKDDRTEQPVVNRDASHESVHHHKQFVESSYSVLYSGCDENDRTERPVVDRDVYSARYSKWDDDKAWYSQEWKADKSMDDRTGQPVVTFWRKTHESQSSFTHEKTQHVIVKRKNLMIERGNPLSALKEEQCHSNSSLETTKQNSNFR